MTDDEFEAELLAADQEFLDILVEAGQTFLESLFRTLEPMEEHYVLNELRGWLTVRNFQNQIEQDERKG